MSESYRNRTVRWIAGAAVVAAVVGVTGCSKEADSDEGKKPAANSSTAAGSEQKGEDPADSQPSKPRQATAEEAVATWVTAVIKGQPKQACLVMAEPASGSSSAQVGTPARCNGNTPEVRKMRENVGKLRTSFTPKQSTGDPKVDVAEVPATGGKTVVPADKVTVDGQTLEKVILSNSTGIKAGQLDVKVEATEIKDAWYVTNLDFNLG
ncbi:hypothetical protein [Streptomyces sp. RTd22]|uniref:hypothetical protein n=1 Tax=Streptomyces sp. RTd22 TaxID=1841249 RepID=UPI0007C4CE6E|nr:hypothetical protein [Streptomyces sp. RTd22]